MIPLIGQDRRNFFLDTLIVRKQFLQPVPDTERLLVVVRPLMNASEGLKDIEQIDPFWFASDRSFECFDGLVGLPHQHQ